jgi:hypothetical protein
VGASLGSLGTMIDVDVRVASGTVLAFGALIVGVRELLGHRPRLIQRNVETPQRWLYRGTLRWALLNGATLGGAVSTRLGFSIWYAIPSGSLLMADPAFGALLYGLYAFTRTVSVYPLLRWKARVADSADVTDVLRSWQPTVRRVCAAVLAGLGAVVIVVVGI